MHYNVNLQPVTQMYTHPCQPDERDYLSDNFKNINYKELHRFNISEYCRKIVNIMHSYIEKPLKHQYVFIKINDLRIGDSTSGTGHWHLDSSLNPTKFYENYIFTTGTHNTEFFKTPIIVSHARNSADFNDQIVKLYDQNRDSLILKPLTIYRYSGSNVHRGRIITTAEKRILIRMSNTNAELPTYK